jgi:hypothetical protein
MSRRVMRRRVGFVLGLGVVVLASACGETLDSYAFTGAPGDNTTSFNIVTPGNYEIDVYGTDPGYGPFCGITASFVNGNDNFTVQAGSTDNVAVPGTSPKYFNGPSTTQDEQLAFGTWNITASSDCDFDIQVGAPTSPT